ncbi:Reticulon-1 [Labeo rohita]|uniref:Reticulon-1 n=1 Tax=Labeo rohita TaxID=84645 RepID=A0ABQ8LNH1_LABRO|nr:Reticulon-1 [Labeo rohita]
MFLSSHADKSDFNFQKKSTDDRDDLYTSLLSNQSYASHEDTSYFSGSLSRSGDKNTSSTEDFTSGSNFLLTSDSDIKINPSADQSDSAHKIHDTEKAFDSSYNYMDISRKEDSCSSQRPLEDWRMSGLSEPIQYTKLEKSPSPVEVDMEDIGSAAILDSQTFPYVEEPSDEELSDYQPYRSPGTGSSASPVKITLTEMPSDTSVSPTTVQHSPTVTVSEKESILSLGLEGVPTVTLSEPEDESPESSTPPTEESDSPLDPNVQAGETKIMSSTQDKTQTSPISPSQPTSKQDSFPMEMKSSPPKPTLPPSPQDVDGSSAESGDSEIELVSEEPSPRAPSTGYMSFSESPTTTSSTTVPSTVPALSSTPAFAQSSAMQYSILREEREAELDSELALESCGEESPKRLTLDFTKGLKESPQPVKKPTTPTSATKEPIVTPTAPPLLAPAPTSAPKEKTSTVEEKPKPSSTTPSPSLPELKVEHPAGEVHQKERRRSSQARRGSERTTAPPVIFQGLTREKVGSTVTTSPSPPLLHPWLPSLSVSSSSYGSFMHWCEPPSMQASTMAATDSTKMEGFWSNWKCQGRRNGVSIQRYKVKPQQRCWLFLSQQFLFLLTVFSQVCGLGKTVASVTSCSPPPSFHQYLITLSGRQRSVKGGKLHRYGNCITAHSTAPISPVSVATALPSSQSSTANFTPTHFIRSSP